MSWKLNADTYWMGSHTIFLYILFKINWFVIAYSWLVLIVRRGRVAWGANLPLRAGCWCSVCAATAQGACGANSVRRGSGAWSQVCMNTRGPWCVWSQFSQEGVRSVVSGMHERARPMVRGEPIKSGGGQERGLRYVWTCGFPKLMQSRHRACSAHALKGIAPMHYFRFSLEKKKLFAYSFFVVSFCNWWFIIPAGSSYVCRELASMSSQLVHTVQVFHALPVDDGIVIFFSGRKKINIWKYTLFHNKPSQIRAAYSGS